MTQRKSTINQASGTPIKRAGKNESISIPFANPDTRKQYKTIIARLKKQGCTEMDFIKMSVCMMTQELQQISSGGVLEVSAARLGIGAEPESASIVDRALSFLKWQQEVRFQEGETL